jgi:putative FmdB family regulatory protein
LFAEYTLVNLRADEENHNSRFILIKYLLTGLKNMPIYEYKCQECGNHLEAMQKISDEPLKECPKCGGNLEKQWSRSGFQFKGTGWYVTDYAGKAATESSSAETKADAKNETKTDAPKTSAGGESTGSADGASKSETTTTSSDKSKP